MCSINTGRIILFYFILFFYFSVVQFSGENLITYTSESSLVLFQEQQANEVFL